jgi:hypothetical protein
MQMAELEWQSFYHRSPDSHSSSAEELHLKPVPPKKKGDWIQVVIISVDHQGVVAEVIACKTKARGSHYYPIELWHVRSASD